MAGSSRWGRGQTEGRGPRGPGGARGGAHGQLPVRRENGDGQGGVEVRRRRPESAVCEPSGRDVQITQTGQRVVRRESGSLGEPGSRGALRAGVKV